MSLHEEREQKQAVNDKLPEREFMARALVLFRVVEARRLWQAAGSRQRHRSPCLFHPGENLMEAITRDDRTRCYSI